MEKLWQSHDRDIPAAYWFAASLGALTVFVCYLTTWWVPAFGYDWFDSVMSPGFLTPGGIMMAMFGGAAGMLLATLPFLSLRWPWAGIGLAMLPLIPSLLDRTPVHFGVVATLCAVAITAGWRRPAATVVALGSAAGVVVLWLLSNRVMEAPFRAEIDHSYWSAGRAAFSGFLYLAALLLVLGGAAALRWSVTQGLERHQLVARAGQVEEQAAVVAERSRLARDLHDVVAHHVSLIAVRAETAPYTHPNIDADSRTVLTDIAADARLALDELRGVLGILGRAGDDASRAPQPAWQDIAALVERSRSTGTVVMLQGDPPETALVSPSVGYAAYRVVQEALTNARKHAAGRPVTVNLVSTGHLVVARVSTPLRGDQVTTGTGHGLAGMRERVEALGGRLQAGPVGDDFVVEATLPQAAA